VSPSVRRVAPPESGLWRVGRSPDPIHFAEPIDPSFLNNATTGNRFDSPTRDYRVCYFATELDGCFGETLARFRPDPALIAISTEEGFMPAGEVPADWRVRRLAVRVRPVEEDRIPILFLDIEALPTRQVLRVELAELLAFHGYRDLDVSVIRGGDRRITRWIGSWAFQQYDDDGVATYAGIRYLSRLSTTWECWAVFNRVRLEEQERRPILRHDESLARIASGYGLTVF
jgi:hypothetical protein